MTRRTGLRGVMWGAIALLVALSLSLSIPVQHPATASGESPHWSYGGAHNPTRWAELSPDYALCGDGQSQSPINLKPSLVSTTVSAPIEFQYQDVLLNVVNSGHGVQVNYAPGSYILIGGQRYDLRQFHFHTPSEHLIEGKAAAMELHLVHQNATGQFAVVSVLIQSGQDNPDIARIWAQIPAPGVTAPAQGMVNALRFLPSDRNSWHYMGSLTTPPCSENVHWAVMNQPIELSPEQIEAFIALYPVNARPVQPRYGRTLERYTDAIPGLW